MADYSSGWWAGTFPISGYTFKDPRNPSHLGTDFGLPAGTPVTAGMAGTIESGYSPTGGNWVAVTSGDTRVYMGHLLQVVKGSGSVNKSDLLGYSGATGDAQGAHLHFQVTKGGTAIDPVQYIKGSPPTDVLGNTTGGGGGGSDPFGIGTAFNNVINTVKTDTQPFLVGTGSAVAFIAIALILLAVGAIAVLIGPAKKGAETVAPIAAAAIK